MTGDRLFGEPRTRGPNERRLGAVAADYRNRGVATPIVEARVQITRSVARSLDRLERNPERSEHTLGRNASIYGDLLSALEMTVAAETHDDIDSLAALFAAVPDDPDR